MNSWYSAGGQKDEIAFSSRVRLARNLVGFPFPSRMNGEQLERVKELVKTALQNDSKYGKKIKYLEMNNIPKTEIFAMVERHIISPEFASNSKNKAIAISDDESICIMIGEEDHIRIQVVLGGMQLENCYNIANEIDDILISKLKFAFDKDLGFLTECPSNIGTGLRASVMLHLPLLESERRMNSIFESIGKIGFTVRGIYGEGSSSLSSLYQISNQITLGLTERNAIENLTAICTGIIERELNARANADKIALEDLVFRAYGILKYQRKLTSKEMMNLVSKLKLGVSMGIIEINKTIPNRILIETQPNMLMKKYGESNADERDILRSEYVRGILQ